MKDVTHDFGTALGRLHWDACIVRGLVWLTKCVLECPKLRIAEVARGGEIAGRSFVLRAITTLASFLEAVSRRGA